ncbi:hypothetical protein DFH09DRAFT_1121168 [Mycena vulgaris]|nr:hypothetical protein DFH09DRAFT_1121168 [Mycena vulgaris]
MSVYWNSYPNFLHNPTAPLQQEFKLLAAQEGWEVGGSRYKKEWERCGQEEFSHHFGCDDKRCVMMRVKEVPDSITQCRKVLRNDVWVNIYDLMDAKRTGLTLALRKYTRNTKKIFPKRAAKENPFLKVSLVELF